MVADLANPGNSSRAINLLVSQPGIVGLAIFEKQGDEHGAASTYHNLGNIALEQRDFASAEQWYRKALAI